jgi:hypothetical protein
VYTMSSGLPNKRLGQTFAKKPCQEQNIEISIYIYGPICSTSWVCIVFESIIRYDIIQRLNKRNCSIGRN